MTQPATHRSQSLDQRINLVSPILPEQHSGVPYDKAANRLGSWSGLMAQAGHASSADAFVPGDIKTARMFGKHFAETLRRISSSV